MTDDKIQQRGLPEDLAIELNFVPKWARRDREGSARAESGPLVRSGAERSEADAVEEKEERTLGARDREGRRPARRTLPSVRPGPREGAGAAARERERRVPRAPVEVFFLPERRQLGVVVHRIQVSRRAYPLLKLAELFLERPEFYSVKLELRGAPSAQSQTGPEPSEWTLYQCNVCGWVDTRKEVALQHVAARHMDQYFEPRTVQEEPPSGQFNAVGECPITGRLIGPPNHHSYTEAVIEAHWAFGATMPLDAYRNQILLRREPEYIERWRQEYARRTVWVLRERPDSEPMSAVAARAWIREQVAPKQVVGHRRVVVPGTVAKQLDDPSLRPVLQLAWEREQRFPMTMMVSLRPALRHMGLHFFKVGGQETYVAAVVPSAIPPDYAIPLIRDTLRYLADHPGARREELARALLGERAAEETPRVELFTHLQWLIEKGHVIEFFDGSLALPKYREDAGRDAARART
jgi:hypothetical protein